MNNIVMNNGSEEVVILNHETEEVHFCGFIRSDRELTGQMRDIANDLLKTLLESWIRKYNSMSETDISAEFRYSALMPAIMKALKLVDAGVVDRFRENMTITAVCCFPGKKKAFWVNTGNDNVYLWTGRTLKRLTSSDKFYKTTTEQNIFNAKSDYVQLVEGRCEKAPRCFYIVSSDAVGFFEDYKEQGKKITPKVFDAFSYRERRPMIIGQVFSK